MLAGVADDLRRGVEAHRLAVQQGAGKDRGVVALHPGRGIDQVGEAGGVALGEAVAAEALDLLEHPLGKAPLVAAPDHALDQLVLVAGDAARQLEGRHGAAQLVGLLRREAGGDDGQPHRLLLEQRHARGSCPAPARSSSGRPCAGAGRGVGRPAPAPLRREIGMDHVALDRPGPHDRHLTTRS